MKIIKSGPEIIGPTEAMEMLSHNYIHNRAISNARVEYLAQEMIHKRFTLNTIILAKLALDAYWSLMNGQHTNKSIIVAGVTIELPVTRLICNSPEEMAKLYSTIDRNRGRKSKDTIKAYSLDNEFGCSVKYGSSIISGVGLILCQFSKMKNYDVQSQIFMKNASLLLSNEIRQMVQILNVSDSQKCFYKRGILAAFITILLSDEKEKAIEFITGVTKNGAMMELGDPRLTVRNYILRMKKGYDAVLSSKHIFKAWNNYVRGISYREINIKKFGENGLKVAGIDLEELYQNLEVCKDMG